MFGGIIQGSKKLVNVLIGIVDVLVLYIDRAQETIPRIKVLAEMRRLCQFVHGAFLNTEYRKGDFLGGVKFTGKRFRIYLKPVICLGTGGKAHSWFAAVKDKTVRLIPGSELDYLRRRSYCFRDNLFRYLKQPAFSTCIPKGYNLSPAVTEELDGIPVIADDTRVKQNTQRSPVNLLYLLFIKAAVWFYKYSVSRHYVSPMPPVRLSGKPWYTTDTARPFP